MPCVVSVDLGCFLGKIDTCHNNRKKSLTAKSSFLKIQHLASGYSLFTHFPVDATKNRLDYYRGKDCMKIFCKD